MLRLNENLSMALSSGVYRTALAVCVAVLPALAAWDYGGVLPWTGWCLSIACLLLLVLSIPLVIQSRPNKPFGYAIAIVGLGVWGYGVLQLIPLPAAIVDVVAPASHQAYLDWIPESLDAELDAVSNEPLFGGRDERWIPISVATYLTKDYLVIPAIFASCVFLGIHVLRGDRELLSFFVITTASGVAMSYLGIADKISENRGAFLTPADAEMPFGSFVNRNNAAGYLNLCLGCCIGALVYRQRMGGSAQDARYQIPEDSISEGIAGSIRRFIRRADNVSIAILIAMIVIVSGILVAGSRGAMLATAAGIVMATYRTIHRTRRFGSLATISLSAIGLGVILGSIGMMETVRYRLSQIMGPAVLEDDRLAHWQDSLRAAIQYGPMGSGLGTYRYAYLPFQKMGAAKWFVNADGMPFEWLLEGGLPMMTLAVVGIVCAYRLLWHLSKRQRTPATIAIDTMTWFVVPSMVISQAFDFGILLLANTMLLGLILGCLSAQASKGVRRKPSRPVPSLSAESDDQSSQLVHHQNSRHSRPNRVAAVSVGVCGFCLLSTLFATIQQNESARVDYVRRCWEDWRPDLVDSVNQIEQICDDTASALQAYPNNAELLDVACQSNVARCRALALPEKLSDLTREQFDVSWMATDPIAMRNRYHAARLSEESQMPWTAVVLPGQDANEWLESRKWALQAFRRSPLNPNVRFMLVSLDFVDDSWTATEDLVKQLRQLHRRRPFELNRVAVLAVDWPGSTAATVIWRDAMALDPQMLPDVWKRVRELGADISLVDLAPQDFEMLLVAAESLSKDQRTEARLIQRIQTMLDQGDAMPGKDKAVWHYQLGRLAMLQGETGKAEKEFSLAIQQNPGESEWRDRYIDILIANENYEEARKQIDRQLLKNPANEKLLKRRKSVDQSLRLFRERAD